MKKMTYLTMVLFTAMTLMSFSCSKDEDDPIVPEGITVADLTGDWNFASLDFNGDVYTDCDPVLNASYNLITLSLIDVTVSTLTIVQECPDANNNLNDMSFSFTNNVISTDGGRKFKIVNIDEFLQNKNVLELELVGSNDQTAPIGGVYTLTR